MRSGLFESSESNNNKQTTAVLMSSVAKFMNQHVLSAISNYQNLGNLSPAYQQYLTAMHDACSSVVGKYLQTTNVFRP